jgi:hypothetical protein
VLLGVNAVTQEVRPELLEGRSDLLNVINNYK